MRVTIQTTTIDYHQLAASVGEKRDDLTGCELLEMCLDAMAGMGFMESTINEALAVKAEERNGA